MWKWNSLFLLLVVPGFAQQPQQAVEPHMGALARVTVWSPDPEAPQRAFDRIRQLDQLLSDYKPESELNRLCRAAAWQPVRVSEDLFRVLEIAQRVSAWSDGAFDVTLGPLTTLWRKGLPPAAEARARTGWRYVQLDASTQSVTLLRAGMQLDLGGIAKGYAAHEALKMLAGSALVAIGGDICAGSAPPGRMGWRVAVEQPGAPRTVVTLVNQCVSTSGDSEQIRQFGGVRSSHILNPTSGAGLSGGESAAVVASNGAIADALATALAANPLLMDGAVREFGVSARVNGRRARAAGDAFR